MTGLRICIFDIYTTVMYNSQRVHDGIFLNSGDSNLGQLVKVMSAGFLYYKTTSFPFVINNHLEIETWTLCKYLTSLQIFSHYFYYQS